MASDFPARDHNGGDPRTPRGTGPDRRPRAERIGRGATGVHDPSARRRRPAPRAGHRDVREDAGGAIARPALPGLPRDEGHLRVARRAHRAVPARLPGLRARIDLHRERACTPRGWSAERDREEVHRDRSARGAAGDPGRRRHRGSARRAALRAIQPLGRAAHHALRATERSGRRVRARAPWSRRVAQHVDLSLRPDRPRAGDDVPPESGEGPHLRRGRRAAAGLDLELHHDHARRRPDPAGHELDLLRPMAAGRRHLQPADGPGGAGGLQHPERRHGCGPAGDAQVERRSDGALVEPERAPRCPDPVQGHARQGTERRARRRERKSAHVDVRDDRAAIGL